MIALLLALAQAAGPEDAVRKHLQDGDVDKAQSKCDKALADTSGSPDLRDLCARAFWPAAEALDTVAAWAAYRSRWSGTRGEGAALEREAAASLRDAGGASAEETALLAVVKAYGGTPAGVEAKELAAKAAIRTAKTAPEVIRVLREYPGADGTEGLARRFLADLVVVTVDGDRITARPKEGVVLPGTSPITSDWAVRATDGHLTAWDDAAEAQLVEEGLDAAFVKAWRAERASRPRAFPLCWNPQGGLSQAVGARVSWNGAEVFVDQGFDRSCGKTAWPVWVVLESSGGRAIAGISVKPGHFMPLATGKGDSGAPWNGTSLYLPDPPVGVLVVKGGAVVGQRVGQLFLVHPLAGGMPWLTADAPPEDSLRLTADLASLPAPPGWSLTAGARGAVVDGPGLDELPAASRVWTLPPGDARALSPLAQEVTGLVRTNPKLTVDGLAPLEKGAWRTRAGGYSPEAPAGASPLALPEVPREELVAALGQLTGAGVVVSPIRGWQLDFDDDPNPELILEATVEEYDVRIVVDPYRNGAVRTFVFDTARPGTRDVGQAFAFERGGAAYVGFTGEEGGLKYVEALHFDARGLIREVARK